MRSKTIKGFRRIKQYWKAESDLERLVATHYGSVVNKWGHFFGIYDRHFSRYRNRGDVRVLELGVGAGGSLDLWRRYFGPTARIVGIDINPDCKKFETADTRVYIGDQEDVAFLSRVADEDGPFDIVIDDAGHHFGQQITSFRTLFPRVRQDGFYCCEDLCTSYWPEEFGGGVGKSGTFVEFAKQLIDELNAWYWRENVEAELEAFARVSHGIYFYADLLIIEKRPTAKPIITPVGIREKKK